MERRRTMVKPILGISMGDPFGNGPEITVKALADRKIYERCRPLVVGDVSSMQYALDVAEKVSGIHLKLNAIDKVEDAIFEYGVIDTWIWDLYHQIKFRICWKRSNRNLLE